MTKKFEPFEIPPSGHSRIRKRDTREPGIDRHEVPLFAGSFIVRADGTIEHSSSESRVWLAVRGFESAMAAFVTGLATNETGASRPSPFEPYAEAVAVRLVSAEAEPRYHVRVHPRTDLRETHEDDAVTRSREKR